MDDDQRFQEIDGFGASLTDSAAWLFAKKLTPAQTDEAFKLLFSRKDGIAVSFLRQPIGSLGPGRHVLLLRRSLPADRQGLHHAGRAHRTRISRTTRWRTIRSTFCRCSSRRWPSIRQSSDALAVESAGMDEDVGIHAGSNPDTKEPSSLRPEFYPAFANYLVKTVEGYQAAGVPVYALSVQNEPLYAPPTYSGMQMMPEEQAAFFGECSWPGDGRRGPEDQSDGLRPQLGSARIS